MAKTAKQKPDESTENVDEIISQEAEATKEVEGDTELEFLNFLLEKQETGKWHGPAAELIRARIKQLENK